MKKIKIMLSFVVLVYFCACIYLFNFYKLECEDILSSNMDFYVSNDGEKIPQIEFNDEIEVEAKVPIFMYHWVRDNVDDYPYPENIAKPEELRKQMEYLKENNYDVIFISDIDGLQHYEKPVVLTFDDGWADVYFSVFPIAKELNMKFCMYVITDLVGTNAYCSLDQLQEMKDSGLVEIDSHTLSHPYLDELSYEQIEKELVGSKAYLRDNLGIESSVICYPSGRQNNNVKEIASRNYEYGLLMDGGVFNYNSKKSDLYVIPRIYAMRSMTLNTFSNYCQSAYVKVN